MTTNNGPRGKPATVKSLKGLRPGFCRECACGAKFSTAKVKCLCGKDNIKARKPHTATNKKG